MPEQPCRILTDAECVELAGHISVPLAMVKYVMQDPNYCVWHEEDVETWEQLKEKAAGWFAYDWQSELHQAEQWVAQRSK